MSCVERMRRVLKRLKMFKNNVNTIIINHSVLLYFNILLVLQQLFEYWSNACYCGGDRFLD